MLSLSVHLTPTLKTCEITFYKQTKIVQAQFVFICYFFTDALEQKRMQTVNLLRYDISRLLDTICQMTPESPISGPTFRVPSLGSNLWGTGSHLWNGSQVSGPGSHLQDLGSGVLAPIYEMGPGSRVSGLTESLGSRVPFLGYAIKVTLLKNL